MRKTAITATVASLVLGVFGIFLRWLQNRTVFEESGLATPGAPVTTVCVIYALLAAAAIAAAATLWTRRCTPAPKAAEALRAATVLPRLLGWLVCAVFVLAGVALMFSAGSASSTLFQRLQRVMGAATVIAGPCFPLLFSRGEEGSALGAPAAFYLPLYFSYWLVYCYQTEVAQDPVTWHFLPEILGLIAAALGVYHVCAWYYIGGRPRGAICSLSLGIFLLISTLPDDRSNVIKALLIATAAILAAMEYVLVENLREK